MENDSMDSGRMEIWSAKLLLFINDGNIFTWLFGIGYENAFNLSDSSQTMGFHNDFLAILCGYGVLGLILFIYIIFIVPFANIHRSDRPILISLIVYLLIASLTLEPLASGNITFWAFYYLILLFSGRYKMPLHNIHQIRMN
jgi:O-antigen ligase